MRLDNSKLTGGEARRLATSVETGGIAALELNNTYGLELNNSHVDLKGLLDIYGNMRGILSHNSHLKYRDLCVQFNQEEGLISTNSTTVVDSSAMPGGTGAGQARSKQTDFSHNGQHLHLKADSTFSFTDKAHLPTTYGNMSFRFAHGAHFYNSDAAQPPSAK